MDPAVAAFERAADLVLQGLGDPAPRLLAQTQLIELGKDLANIPLLQRVLDQSNSSYAITTAAQSLQRLVTDNWNSFTEPMRVQIRA